MSANLSKNRARHAYVAPLLLLSWGWVRSLLLFLCCSHVTVHLAPPMPRPKIGGPTQPRASRRFAHALNRADGILARAGGCLCLLRLRDANPAKASSSSPRPRRLSRRTSQPTVELCLSAVRSCSGTIRADRPWFGLVGDALRYFCSQLCLARHVRLFLGTKLGTGRVRPAKESCTARTHQSAATVETHIVSSLASR